MEWLLDNMLAVSTGVYLTILVAMVCNFKLVGYHNAMFASFMATLLVTHLLELITMEISFHVMCIGVAAYTLYNLRERLRYVR